MYSNSDLCSKNSKKMSPMIEKNSLVYRGVARKFFGYQFCLLWCKGKTNHVADALSRYPVFQPEPEDCKDVLACTVLARRATEPQEDLAMDMIKEYAKEDQEYNKIYKAIV